jgi:hypothetical protein
MVARLLGLLGLIAPFPEFLTGRPETKTVLEVGGVKFIAFTNRAEVQPGARVTLFIVIENAYSTSRMIRFQIDASSAMPGADAGLESVPRASSDLKDGETGLIVVPVLVSPEALPGPRLIGLSARARYEHIGRRIRAQPRRRAVSGEAASPCVFPFQVTPVPAAGSNGPAPRLDFSYYELWNVRDLPSSRTIVDQVWNNIRVIVGKEP